MIVITRCWFADGYCDDFYKRSRMNFDGGDCCPGDCVEIAYDCATYAGTCDDCIDPDSADNALMVRC